MYWDPKDGVNFQYRTDVVGYHPYLSVALSVLGYLLFALAIFACHKNGIFKNYGHTVFLILTYAFVIDIFETGQTLYFIFNMPDEKSQGRYNVRTGRYTVRLPTTVFIVSIYQFVVRFCGKELKLSTLYSAFGIFLTISVGYFASALIFREVDTGLSGIRPVLCTAFYTVNGYALLVGFLSCIGIALITPIFPILTLIKGAVKKHNDIGLTTFLLISSLPASSILIGEIISSFASYSYNQPKPAIVQLLYSFQQFRFPLLCLLTLLIIKEIRDAVFSTIPVIIHTVFKRDISVTINVDLFHLETGKKNHIEKTFNF